MNNLVDDITPLIAAYLPAEDAINFSKTSKKLNSQLSLSSTTRWLIDLSKDDCSNNHNYGFQIPIPLHAAVHSICISMDWEDQGWGNQKGHVLVTAGLNPMSDASSKIIFSSGIASHHAEQLKITFTPKEGVSYHLYYRVGGGGGHSLHLSNIRVRALMVETSFLKDYSKCHQFLVSCNDNAVTLDTILATASHMLNNGMQIPPAMNSFFGPHLSIELLECIATNWNSESYDLPLMESGMLDTPQPFFYDACDAGTNENAYQNVYVDGGDSSVEDPAYRPFSRIRRRRGRGFLGMFRRSR